MECRIFGDIETNSVVTENSGGIRDCFRIKFEWENSGVAF
jgi:hypothetical protein